MNAILAELTVGFDLYVWVVIPLLIFAARIADVSIGIIGRNRGIIEE